MIKYGLTYNGNIIYEYKDIQDLYKFMNENNIVYRRIEYLNSRYLGFKDPLYHIVDIESGTPLRICFGPESQQ